MLHLFSTREELLKYGQAHYKPHSQETSSLLYRLFRAYSEEADMPEKLKEFVRETIDELLRGECIWSILSLIGMFVGRSPESLGVQRVEIFPLLDGPGDDSVQFGRAVDLLTKLVVEGPPVLVHCRAGRSRSAAVVAAYLMRSRGLTSEDSVNFVGTRRRIDLNPEMAGLVKQFGDDERSKSE